MNEENKKSALKWYFKPAWVIVALLAAGPFALPLLWLSPALKKWHKITLTVLMAVFTLWLVKATVDIYQLILKQVAELQDSLR